MKGRLKAIIAFPGVVASPNFTTALAMRPMVRLSAMLSARARLAALLPVGRPAYGPCSSSSLSTCSAAAVVPASFLAAAALSPAAGAGSTPAAACLAAGSPSPDAAAAAAFAAARACGVAAFF